MKDLTLKFGQFDPNTRTGTGQVGGDEQVICPFCKSEMRDTGEDEYKCLSLTCLLAEHQSILGFTFSKNEIPVGI